MKLSNGINFDFVAPSGVFGFDGRGWWWDYPFRWFRLLDPKLFLVIAKTLTLEPRPGNLRKTDIFGRGCIRHIKNGTVNSVGLTNDGFSWWMERVAPRVKDFGFPLGVSISGPAADLTLMASELAQVPIACIEVDASCPNSPGGITNTAEAIHLVRTVQRVTRHPVLAKLSTAQDCQEIIDNCDAEAFSFNSVPWNVLFPDKESPLAHLNKLTGGGVSGRVAQKITWPLINMLSARTKARLIMPHITSYKDMEYLDEDLGLYPSDRIAWSFGVAHLPNFWNPLTWWNPARPTSWIRRWKKANA